MYKQLKVDFEIPECIQKDIEQMLEYMNAGGKFPDISISNLRSDIYSFDLDLEPVQQEILRNYYCRGGIFANG